MSFGQINFFPKNLSEDTNTAVLDNALNLEKS